MDRIRTTLALAGLVAGLAGPGRAQELVYDFADTQACLEMVDTAIANGADVTSADKLACIGRSAEVCMEATEGGWSTYGQGACLDAELTDWDSWLNVVYGEAMAGAKAFDAETRDYAPDAAIAARSLLDMQRAWIGFRDAACGFEASLWGGGTGAGPAFVSCMMVETARQVLRLEEARGFY